MCKKFNKEFVRNMNMVFEPTHIEIQFYVFYKEEYVGVVYATKKHFQTICEILKEKGFEYECEEYSYFCEEY